MRRISRVSSVIAAAAWLAGILSAGVLAAPLAGAAEGRWLTSYDEAMAAAREQGRPVLTIFTGSDWCPHCRTLESNVLHTDTFRAWAEDRLVLLMIDLPQEGISAEERRSRSSVCIKYGVRTFPSAVLIGPDGGRITAQTGYVGQSAATWVAALESHVPARETGRTAAVHSSLDEAVETARDADRPILVMVSRSSDSAAATRVTTLIEDPEFKALARDSFVVAKVRSGAADAAAIENLLQGEPLAADGVELIVTDDGRTPLHVVSGAEPPQRVVSGLRRFLASRQSVRR